MTCKQNKFVFHSLESRSLRSRYQYGLVQLRALFQVIDGCILINSSCGREQREKTSSLMTLTKKH